MARTKPAIFRRFSLFFPLALIFLPSLGSSSLWAKTEAAWKAQQEEAIFAVNCGGPEYTDKKGIVYKADNHFSGGQTYKTKAAIAGTEDDVLYQAERWGKFSYNIPLANGDYTVTLKFAEIYEYGKWAGMRVFSVKVEGKKVISDLDLVVKAGQYKAFDVVVPVKVVDGILNIEFYNQRETAKVNAILVTKQGMTPPLTGTIKGHVTDSSTGLPLPQATVSVTDSSNIPKSTLTDQNGAYEIPGIAVGAFNGEIKKNGYSPYQFQGTMAAGQTIDLNAALKPIFPVISEVDAKDVTTDTARIVWKTDQPADSLVDYGETEAYGSKESNSTLTKSHELLLRNLKSGTLYHYKVTSRNEYGFASSSEDQTFTTQNPSSPITLDITYPVDGSTIASSSVRVEGTVRNKRGIETGVVVNGVLANMIGDQFVANHVPLTEGLNTIKAVATDVQGNREEIPVNVKGIVSDSYLRISADVDSGLPPLEVVLTLDSNLDLSAVSITTSGPGEVERLDKADGKYRVLVTVEGVYIFTARVPDPNGFVWEDSIAITVFSNKEVTALLGAKWVGMKGAMANQDIDGALTYFAEESREIYREQLNALKALISDIVNEFNAAEIQLKAVDREVAEFEVLVVREGARLSFGLKFIKDPKGIWKMWRF